MRFRYSGIDWAVCDPVHALGLQVESAWPERHPSDGTLAGGNHAIWPASDHGKDPNGVVRAIDVGVLLGQGSQLVSQLVESRDYRLRYIIHNRLMWRSYPKPGIEPWEPAPYTGSNGHINHVHVSMQRDAASDIDPTPFDIDLGAGTMFLTVEQLQEALNEAGQTDADGNALAVDGDYGEKTAYAFANGLRAAEVSGDYATVEWVRGFVRRKTDGMMTYGETYSARKAT